jgi:hypothetical protein
MKLKYFTLQKIRRHHFFTKVCAKSHVHDAKKRRTNLILIIEVHAKHFSCKPMDLFWEKKFMKIVIHEGNDFHG